MHEIIKKEYIHLHCQARSKEAVLLTASHWAMQAGILADEAQFLKGLWERENEFSTAVGSGIAIPHCRSDAILQPSVFYIKLDQPVPWSSEEQIDLILLLAVPQSHQENTHIRLLSQIARKLIDDHFIQSLRDAGREEEIYALLNDIQL